MVTLISYILISLLTLSFEIDIIMTVGILHLLFKVVTYLFDFFPQQSSISGLSLVNITDRQTDKPTNCHTNILAKFLWKHVMKRSQNIPILLFVGRRLRFRRQSWALLLQQEIFKIDKKKNEVALILLDRRVNGSEEYYSDNQFNLLHFDLAWKLTELWRFKHFAYSLTSWPSDIRISYQDMILNLVTHKHT